MVLILLRQLHVGITDEQKKLQRIICSISSPKPALGSQIVVSFQTLITVQRVKKHPLPNKRQAIEPDAKKTRSYN